LPRLPEVPIEAWQSWVEEQSRAAFDRVEQGFDFSTWADQQIASIPVDLGMPGWVNPLDEALEIAEEERRRREEEERIFREDAERRAREAEELSRQQQAATESPAESPADQFRSWADGRIAETFGGAQEAAQGIAETATSAADQFRTWADERIGSAFGQSTPAGYTDPFASGVEPPPTPVRRGRSLPLRPRRPPIATRSPRASKRPPGTPLAHRCSDTGRRATPTSNVARSASRRRRRRSAASTP
jgi:hypothetical protein